MRLFTTRARRPDRPPVVRPLDLAGVAAGRGPANAAPAGRGPESAAAAIAAALSVAAGVPVRNSARACPSGPMPPAVLELVATAGDRRLSIELDVDTRRGWLGLVLGLPAGTPSEAELPVIPSPFERSVLARTLVEPVARARWGHGIAASTPVGVEPRSPGDRGSAASTTFRLVASSTAGGLELTLVLNEPAVEGPSPSALERSIRSASLPMVVTLDPARTGVSLRAADLARFEPGDVLVTDLPADSPGGLPVAVGVRSISPWPSTGRGTPDFPVSMTPKAALKGRLGTAGGRRGVRFEVSETDESPVH